METFESDSTKAQDLKDSIYEPPDSSSFPRVKHRKVYLNAEIRLQEDLQTYYCAKVIDVKDASVHVRFTNDVWKQKAVKPENVRLAPPKSTLSTPFKPQVGEQAEWFTPLSDATPENWRMCYLSVVPSDTDTKPYEVVEAMNSSVKKTVYQNNIRPVSTEKALQLETIKRLIVSVPQSLQFWARSQEASEYYDDVIEQSGILAIVPVGREEPSNPKELSQASDSTPVDIVLMGEKDLIQKGVESLLSLFKYQKRLLSLSERRGRRLKFLEERRSKYDDSIQCEFVTNDALLGLIIGKQGEKLNGVAKQHKVEIRVLPADGNYRRIRIYGATVESVKESRAALEYVYHELPVDPSIVGWLLGRKGENIKEICHKSGLHAAWFDDTKDCLVLFGIHDAIAQAVVQFDAHIQNLSMHKEGEKKLLVDTSERSRYDSRQMLYISPQVGEENAAQITDMRGILPTVRNPYKNPPLAHRKAPNVTTSTKSHFQRAEKLSEAADSASRSEGGSLSVRHRSTISLPRTRNMVEHYPTPPTSAGMTHTDLDKRTTFPRENVCQPPLMSSSSNRSSVEVHLGRDGPTTESSNTLERYRTSYMSRKGVLSQQQKYIISSPPFIATPFPSPIPPRPVPVIPTPIRIGVAAQPLQQTPGVPYYFPVNSPSTAMAASGTALMPHSQNYQERPIINRRPGYSSFYSDSGSFGAARYNVNYSAEPMSSEALTKVPTEGTEMYKHNTPTYPSP